MKTLKFSIITLTLILANTANAKLNCTTSTAVIANFFTSTITRCEDNSGTQVLTYPSGLVNVTTWDGQGAVYEVSYMVESP